MANNKMMRQGRRENTAPLPHHNPENRWMTMMMTMSKRRRRKNEEEMMRRQQKGG